ncbi:MAG: hypothetical protein ABR599_06770 [Gemmatimonadota bacterium]
MAKPSDKRSRPAPARRRGTGEPGGARLAFGTLNYVLFAAAAVAIVLGYVLLSRGSITLAPILLVLGYVVLMPAGILVRGGAAED